MDTVTHIIGGMIPVPRADRVRADVTAAVTRWELQGPPSVPRLYLLGRRLVRMGATDVELVSVASELMWQHRGRRLQTEPGRPGRRGRGVP